MSLDELGLTPMQLAEISDLSDELTAAWLEAITPAVKNPAAWFLAGVRSGARPHGDKDVDRARNIHLAERYIATAGLFIPESELIDELFGARGRLRHWPELEPAMLKRWAALQPDAERVDAERLARAERWQQAHLAMQALGTKRTVPHDDAQPLHSSQTSTALTAVSAHTPALDADADIAW